MTAILKVDTIQDTAGNNIINESSNTITIGASGDTTNIVGTLQNNGAAVGNANTPAFFAHKTGNQTVAQDTQVLVAFETEIFDTNNTFTNTSGNYKFTPGVSGKYVIHASLYFATPAAGNFHRLYVYKNGSSYAELGQSNNGYEEGVNMSTIVDSDTNDYFQIYTRHNKGSSITVQGNTTWGDVVSGFGAYKLIT